MTPRHILLLAGAALFAGAAPAQEAPMASTLPAPIPVSRDVPWPGVMTLDVDTTTAAQGYFTVHQVIPVAAAGPMILLYPQWKPGNHAPSGQIKNLAGVKFSAGGKPLAWHRDTVDMFAFHLDVPKGAKTVEADFQYLSPLDSGSDRIIVAPAMLNLEWDEVSLYPAGTYVRQIKVKPSVTYPAGWTGFTALRGTKASNTVHYDSVAYDVLVDSPIFAGAHTKQIALDPAMSLDLVADTEAELAITPAQIAAHKALVVQADRLFGARHYDHYDLLVALSDFQSGEGLEHHRSSENSLDGNLFTEWDDNVAEHYVVAHEYTHSWNGKFRRPFDLWTPDYHTPMQNSLLWVYEGQTQFWGDVLAARSGLWSKQEYLDMLALVAANYTEGTPGTAWRPLQDTTNDPILTGHGDTSEWPSWSRGYDYYRNAELIWLEADQIIREQSGGARGLDDFAKAFFGVRPGDWSEYTYTFDDVVAALNAVQPYDWASFLRGRLDGTSPATTLNGIEKAGYRLVFTDTPSKTGKAVAAARKSDDFTYSLGLTIGTKAVAKSVLWQSAAWKAGLRPNDTIVAVGGLAYTPEKLRAAVTAAKGAGQPISLIVNTDGQFRTVSIDYHGGLRYPHLERTSTGEAGLDRLISAK
jgi:predicted metalloprotease with PDZ domain